MQCIKGIADIMDIELYIACLQLVASWSRCYVEICILFLSIDDGIFKTILHMLWSDVWRGQKKFCLNTGWILSTYAQA